MQSKSPFILAGIVLLAVSTGVLRADEVDMQNGDRYFGTVLSMSSDTLVFQSEMLGRLNVPRKKVAGLVFGTKAALQSAKPASPSVSINTSAADASPALAGTNPDFSAALRSLGANTNFIAQVRQQMLGGNPEAASNYDQLMGGLMDGSVSIGDLRRQAQTTADQLREMKRELGPEAGASLDSYLEVLDNFLSESAPTNTAPAAKAQGP